MKLELRTEQGSKIRKAGLIPGVLYGKGIESTPVQAPIEEFRKEYQTYGETKTFKVKLEGKTHIVYFKDTQAHYMNFHNKLHFDLVKVSKDDTLTAQVYVRFLNKTDVKKRALAIQAFTDHVDIEFPVGSGIDQLEVDLTGLEVHTEIKAKDLVLPKGISLVTDPETIILQIQEQRVIVDEPEEEEVAVAPKEVEAIKQSND